MIVSLETHPISARKIALELLMLISDSVACSITLYITFTGYEANRVARSSEEDLYF